MKSRFYEIKSINDNKMIIDRRKNNLFVFLFFGLEQR